MLIYLIAEMQKMSKLISNISIWFIIACCRRSRQQWTQLLRKIYRKTEKLRAWNQRGRIRSGRHDDIHKRILLRWDRTGRVFLGGEHFNAHAAGIHRPVSGNGKDQVGRKFFSPSSTPRAQYSRRYSLLSNSHFAASLLTFLRPARNENENEKWKKKKKKKKRNDGVAYAVRVDAWWKRRRGRERRKRGGWLLDVSGITIRDEMKLKELVVCVDGRVAEEGSRGGWKERKGRENGIAGVQLIKRELYSDLVRISFARALYYVSTRHSSLFFFLFLFQP